MATGRKGTSPLCSLGEMCDLVEGKDIENSTGIYDQRSEC